MNILYSKFLNVLLVSMCDSIDICRLPIRKPNAGIVRVWGSIRVISVVVTSPNVRISIISLYLDSICSIEMLVMDD